MVLKKWKEVNLKHYMKNNIIPEKMYSAKAVVDLKVLNFTSRNTLYKMLKEKSWQEVFKPVIVKKDILTMYYIKGQNIINYLKKQENEN